MEQWKTKNGIKITQLLKHRCNVYLIQSAHCNILFDTSIYKAFPILSEILNSLEIKALDYLIISHLHYDHCQNSKQIKEKYHCKIIHSQKERVYAKSGFTPFPKGTNHLVRMISRIGNRMRLNRHRYEPFDGDVLIKDHPYQVNEHLQLIETPGHSKGSLSIIVDNEIAIVGDALFGILRNKVFPPFADDIPELIKTWSKLLKTPCKIFLPGHGKAIPRPIFEKEFNKYNGLFCSSKD